MATAMTRLIDTLKAHPAVEVHEPASIEEIRRALRIVRVKLPSSVIEYLTTVGWIAVNGEPVFGLGPSVDESTSLEARTADAWVCAEPSLPSRYVPMMDDGMGGYYCLDTQAATGEDCSVVHWDHEDPAGEEQIPEVVSDSFTQWLTRLVDEAPAV